MSQKAEYRSAIRSRKLIRKAFLELIRIKDPDKITVTDIIGRAELNRGTFYAHYADINVLMRSIEDEIVQDLCELLSDVKNPNLLNDPLPMFLKISEYLEQNKELIIALMYSRKTNPFIVQLPDLIAKHLAASEKIEKEVRSGVSFEERCCFYAGGAASLYMSWFRGSVSGNLEDIAYMLSDIIKRHNA